MSRRRHRPAAASPVTPAVAAEAPADPTPGDPLGLADSELHRLALARRQARRGEPAASTAGAPVPTSSVPQGTATSVPVAGMTCRSCEVRIERQVRRLPGVTHVAASSTRGRVEIQSLHPIPEPVLAGAIRAAGYEVGATPWIERNPRVWLTAGAGILLLAVAVLVARATGVADLASQTGDLAEGGVLVALLLGLAAGVSTCMALVGGLVLALSASYEARRERLGLPDRGVAGQLRPAVVFLLGRVAGYAVLGAALGAIGASLAMPPMLTAALMLAAAVVMTLVGARLTGLSPRVAAWSPTLPPSLARSLGLADTETGAYSDVRAATLGALSFFMPCGFTQAVQVYALSTGSPVTAGLLLAAFALGTVPGLLALAGLPVVVPGRARPTLLRLVGVVVLGFAVVNAGAGLRLAGVNVSPFGTAAAVAAGPAGDPAAASLAPAGSAQELRTYQEVDGYWPSTVEIAAGVPTRWVIESASSRSCAAFLVVPDLGIQVRLHEGENVIDLPPLEAGTLGYTCSMGMYFGSITIVDREAAVRPAG